MLERLASRGSIPLDLSVGASSTFWRREFVEGGERGGGGGMQVCSPPFGRPKSVSFIPGEKYA